MSGCVVGRSGKGVKAIATRSDAILNGAVKMPMTVEARMVTGGRRMDGKKLTDRLNAPIQGTAADGLKLVLALLWELRSECPGAVPVLVCHDEVVVECDAEQAKDAKACLEKAMVEGMDTAVNDTDERHTYR